MAKTLYLVLGLIKTYYNILNVIYLNFPSSYIFLQILNIKL